LVAFVAGSHVIVRQLSDILQTLDKDGSLGGLQWMPEMAVYCGTRQKVVRRLTRICDDALLGKFWSISDAYILSTGRCDGSHHAGCQLGCALFWRDEWLVPDTPSKNFGPKYAKYGESESIGVLVEPECSASPIVSHANQTESLQYRCQVTSYKAAATTLGWFGLGAYFDDLLSRNRSLICLLKIIALALMDELSRSVGGPGYPRSLLGENMATPNEESGLQPGDLVIVKSIGEISKTLDTAGRNRGLLFDRCMVKYVGKIFKVDARIERFISPATGKMILTKKHTPLIRLAGLTCDGIANRGCHRSDYLLWREIWLRKLDVGA
jgi:hypothetical protein